MRTCSSTGTIELGNLRTKIEEVRKRSNENYDDVHSTSVQ